MLEFVSKILCMICASEYCLFKGMRPKMTVYATNAPFKRLICKQYHHHIQTDLTSTLKAGDNFTVSREPKRCTRWLEWSVWGHLVQHTQFFSKFISALPNELRCTQKLFSTFVYMVYSETNLIFTSIVCRSGAIVSWMASVSTSGKFQLKHHKFFYYFTNWTQICFQR